MEVLKRSRVGASATINGALPMGMEGESSLKDTERRPLVRNSTLTSLLGSAKRVNGLKGLGGTLGTGKAVWILRSGCEATWVLFEKLCIDKRRGRGGWVTKKLDSRTCEWGRRVKFVGRLLGLDNKLIKSSQNLTSEICLRS